LKHLGLDPNADAPRKKKRSKRSLFDPPVNPRPSSGLTPDDFEDDPKPEFE